MRTNITSAKRKRIDESLPGLKRLIANDEAFLASGVYQKVAVSVFDHWLSETEASELIPVDDDLAEIKNRRATFKAYVKGLNELTDLYSWRYKRHNRFHIQKPSSVDDILRMCDFGNLWSASGRRYGFLMPEFSAVFIEEWDWTNVLWYRDKDAVTPLLELAKRVGLFVLE